MKYKIDYNKITELVGEYESEIVKQFDDYILENGLPNNLLDSAKYPILSRYVEYHQHLNNILYFVENKLKKLFLNKSVEESLRFKELKEDEGIKSSVERKEMIYSDLGSSSSKLIELSSSIIELENIKWLILNKFNLINTILKMY